MSTFGFVKIAPILWRAFQRRAEIGLLWDDLMAIYEAATPAIREVRKRWPAMEPVIKSLIAEVVPAASTKMGIDFDPWKPDLKWVQENLKQRGLYTGPIDGKLGPLTVEATKKVQTLFGFSEEDIDGLPGDQTIAAMLAHPIEDASDAT